jgi:hypothetical protein
MVGAVVSAVQVKAIWLTAELLPQASVALMLKVRVRAQGGPLSALVTLMVGVPQSSVAVTWAAMLAFVGRLAGLQPRALPVGTWVSVGG